MTSANDVEPRLHRGDWLIEHGVKEFKGHQLCGLEEIIDFARFPCVAAAVWGKIANNVLNGSLLDTLIPQVKKLMVN